MVRTKYNKKIAPMTDDAGSFFSDDPITGNIVQGFYSAFFEVEASAHKLIDFLGSDFMEAAPYSNPRAGNGAGHSGTFIRFRTEHHSIEDVRAFLATLP